MEFMSDAVTAFTNLDQNFSFFSFGSDHVPFQDAGIPAILCIDLDWDEYPDYHRTTDVFANVDPDFGVQIARAGVATIAHLAGYVDTVDAPGPAPAPPVPLAVYPNPAVSRLEIAVDADAGEMVSVYSLAGELVRRFRVVDGGFTRIEWDLSDDRGFRLPAGVYYVRAGTRTQRAVTLR